MSRLLHHIQTLLTVLALLAGTLQMAYASGQAPAVDEMVICTGHTAVTIGIDADGNPTGEVFYCPDCATSALIAVDSAAAPIGDCRPASQAVFAAGTNDLPTPQFAVPYPARGPPVSV